MKVEEFKELMSKATERPWHCHDKNALGVWLVYPPKERLLFPDKSLGPDEPKMYPLEDTEGNAKAICETMNRADLLAELWEACDNYKKAHIEGLLFPMSEIQKSIYKILEKLEETK